MMIDQSAFTFILKHNPEIAIRMMRKLVIRLQQTTELLEEAVGHKVDIEESGIKDTESGAEPDPNARLVEISSGITFPLADSRDTTVGRIDPVTGIHPDVDLTPVDGKRSISRRHARMRHEDDGSYGVIEDVGTMNGTFVNGVRLVAGRLVPGGERGHRGLRYHPVPLRNRRELTADGAELLPGDPLTKLKGIGPKSAEALSAEGVNTVLDLLLHLPRRYEDRTRVTRLDQRIESGSWVLLRGRVKGVRLRRIATTQNVDRRWFR